VIGILGGTFDPVHVGHLRVAIELREALALDEVRLVPCGVPPHRGTPAVTAVHRLAMCRLAVDDEPGLSVDPREVERPGPSYMVDTLAALRAEVGAERPLALLLGADAFLALHTWNRWEALRQLAHLVVVHRPGWALDSAAVAAPLAPLLASRGDAAGLRRAAAGGVVFQPVAPLDVSATALRARVAAGRSIRFLVPDPVWRYIRDNNLY
jgi:nicotinate-nucleotide adenylyltransferase